MLDIATIARGSTGFRPLMFCVLLIARTLAQRDAHALENGHALGAALWRLDARVRVARHARYCVRIVTNWLELLWANGFPGDRRCWRSIRGRL